MYTKEELLVHLTVALHPQLKKHQRYELVQQTAFAQSLPTPSEAILHWLDSSLKWLNQSPSSRHILTLSHPSYPSSLRDLKDPPLILFCEGNLSLLQNPCLAMVGSRSPSRVGSQLAHDFAFELSDRGWCIVSGLAEGVDGACHKGALKAQGQTIAVLGGALDRIYPKTHQPLANQIIEQSGLLVSEYPPGTNPRPAFFPQRNRIIAALSEGTLVVEAAIKSGSLITARVASELGRMVMALPGSIHSPHSKGCHEMIKKGALLVETAQEINDELQASLTPCKMKRIKKAKANPAALINNPAESLSPEFKHLLNHLSTTPEHLDDLARKAEIDIEQAFSCLTEMELDGWVINEAGNRWVKAKF